MLSALSTTDYVTDWLRTAVSTSSARATSPRVLHVFDRVCNLVDARRRVISLVSLEIGNGPFSLVIDLPEGNFTDFLSTESQVSIQDSPCHAEQSEASHVPSSSKVVGILRPAQNDGFLVQVGPLILDTRTAKLWATRPLWESVSATIIKAYLPLFESKLAIASPDSLAHVNGYFDRLNTGRADPTAQKANTAITILQKGLEIDDEDFIREGTRNLAGLGSGLTPAGDDFLLGVMHGLWLTNFSRKDAKTQRIAETIAKESMERTTTLSKAWLEAAGKGKAGEVWHELVGAMGVTSTGSVNTVPQIIDRILATGHTSGADALAGFVMALQTIQTTRLPD